MMSLEGGRLVAAEGGGELGGASLLPLPPDGKGKGRARRGGGGGRR